MLAMRAYPFLLALALAACGENPDVADQHPNGHGNHDHAPKYDGRLVELGDHEFQVELRHYPDEGKLEAYMWDGHVEVPVPCAMKSIRIEGEAGSNAFSIELKPVKIRYAKAVEGKSTKFSGQHDALKGAKSFTGKLVEVSLADKTFTAVAFEYTEKDDHDHGDHDHEHE